MNTKQKYFSHFAKVTIAAFCVALASCATNTNTASEEEIKSAQRMHFIAEPAVVTAAAVEVMQEMDEPEDIYIEQLDDTSFFATRSALVYVVISASHYEYRFAFRATPNPDGGTIASLAISRGGETMLVQQPRVREANIEPYSLFWDRVAAKLGEGGGNYNCPKAGNEEGAYKYDSVCMFAGL